MKKVFLIAYILHFISMQANAQNEENVWVFGDRTGLDFTATSPVPVVNELFPGYKGSASICDAGGQLLFYSNGYWVWDKNNFLMPGLTSGISGYTGPSSPSVGYPPLMNWTGSFASQSAAICGMPNNAGKYYLFSLNTTGQLYYSQIDMSLNSGNGDLVPGKTSIFLDGALCEKMTVVKGCNNIWLIVKSRVGNNYKAFEINDTGIVTTPVLSNVGLLPSSWYQCGVIKFSPDAKKMAAACFSSAIPHGKGGLELYDFDPSTGKLTNPVVLDSSSTMGYYYGTCFSPDNTKLYASTSSFFDGSVFRYGKIHQFDLSLSSTAAIIASNTTIYNDIITQQDNIGDLKRGKDGKIYVGSGSSYLSFTPFMHCINFPNLAGMACGMTPNAIAMPPGAWSHRSIPNDIALIDAPDTTGTIINITACFADSVDLIADTGKRYQWSNGSNQKKITVYNNAIYSVSFINTSCQYQKDTYIVRFISLPTWNNSGYSCPGAAQAKAWVKPSIGDTTTFMYEWKDAMGNIFYKNTTRFADTVSGLDTGRYFLTIKTVSGCDTTILIHILPLPLPIASMIVDSIACKGTAISFINTSNVPLWKWYFGDGNTSNDNNPKYSYNNTGNYTTSLVVTNIEGCSDTIPRQISVKDLHLNLNANSELVEVNDVVILQSSSLQPYTVETWQPAYLFNDQSAYRQNVKMDTTHTFVVFGRSEEGCVDSASVKVTVNPLVSMPNAFTPNGDGKNDRFRPVAKGYIFVRYFEVYNRFGQKVYSAFGPKAQEGWDGSFNGKPVEIGTYYYHINIETESVGTIYLKGDVIVIR